LIERIYIYIYNLIRRTRGYYLELNGFDIRNCKLDIESEAITFDTQPYRKRMKEVDWWRKKREYQVYRRRYMIGVKLSRQYK